MTWWQKMEELEVVNQTLWCFLQWGILGLVMFTGDAGARISSLRLPQRRLLSVVPSSFHALSVI